ncbi:HNH endonuclease [Streptomyces sp. 184]|uniref:HNH endonuclease n=1 Tax=Streptomyces sp. 184 TaxID=1827526 RepID=UPI003891C0C2
MALGDVGRAEILRAVGEFDRLGRAAFLRRYGFQESRRYVLVVDGRRYDSKAVVGAAHGFLPGREPLAASEFSGGRGHAVKLLADLGFQVVEQGAVTEVTADGLVERIGALRVAHAPTGPLLYQPITLLWAFGRALRGEPRLLAWDETSAALGGLLERHGRRGERSRPDYPVLALFHAGLWALHGYEGTVPPAHGDAVPRRWFEEQRPAGGLAEPVHELMRTSGPARVAAIQAITERFFDGFDEVPLLTDVGLYDESVAASAGSPVTDPVLLAAQYERLCHLVESREESRRGQRRETVSRDPIRSGSAREAVIARSRRRCENPGCGGQPDDVTDSGAPILEVDHVVGLADDGPDHPRQMIALCPNCHAVKTRGRTRHELRDILIEVAAERHERMGGPPP